VSASLGPCGRSGALRAGAVVALAAALLAGCAPLTGPGAPTPGERLTARIDSIISSPPLDGLHWGILVREHATGRVLYERAADRKFIPASNTKLVVTAVAMGVLGPEWRYTTPLVAVRPPGDSVAAELRVRGSGDPTFSARFHDEPLAALDSMAWAVRAAGITRVTGNVVVEADAFVDPVVLGAWEVGDLPWYYAAPTAAFAVAEGTFQLIVEPGPAPGYPGRARVLGGSWLDLEAEIVTDTAGASSQRSVDFTARRDAIHLTGSIAADAGADTVTLAVTRPAEYAGRALRSALERAGVVVEGGTRVDDVDSQAAPVPGGMAADTVARLRSAPLLDIVTAILQPSQNWMAEQLLKTLGAMADSTGIVNLAAAPAGGSWRAGLDVEGRYLTQVVGVDSLSFSLRDASGLSAQNVLSPRTTVTLLDHAHARWGDAWDAALAGPGVAGSTLNRRLTALEGRVFGKTGTIANVNALSGYLLTRDGRRLTFSILTNGSGLPASRVRQALDAIVEATAREAGMDGSETP